MDRAVARGLTARPLTAPAHVGVDEKAAGRGQDYITVVADLDTGTVDYIADERRQASLDGYFEKFTPEQLAGIQAVAMDMWEPFANSVRAHLTDPDDKIVFDRYHLMGYPHRRGGHRPQAREPGAGRGRWPRAWPVRSTSGCTRPRTCPTVTPTGSPRCRPGTCAPRGRGRSRRACGTSGPISAAAGRPSTSTAGTSGPPTAGSNRSSTRLRHSNVTRRAAVLLRPPDHQRRRRRPQLPHPGDQSLSAWLPQPRALQDRDLLPPRWPTALPGHTMTHGLPGSALSSRRVNSLSSPSSPPDASSAPFPHRSPRRSSANAACGGLKPSPIGRSRRASDPPSSAEHCLDQVTTYRSPALRIRGAHSRSDTSCPSDRSRTAASVTPSTPGAPRFALTCR